MSAASGVLSVAIVLAAARAGSSGLDFLKTDTTLDAVSRVAVIVLLFHASVESTVGEMKKLGLAAVLVAASLTATSVGVTARVLRDLGHARGGTAHLILAAAVVDDVIGLIVLAVMGASGSIPVVLLKASVLLVGGLAVGMFVSPRLLSLASRSMAIVLLAAAFAFCFVMAWLASLFGLAPIVGAFAAGLAVEEWHYQDFIDRRERTLDDLITPIASWLVPVFFVMVGIRTDLSGLARPSVIALAAALTVAAIAGKQLCALGVSGGQRTVDRVAVGLGMMPRGEVTLIFANAGVAMAVIKADVFLALVLTVIVTTIVTPAALTWRLGRAQ